VTAPPRAAPNADRGIRSARRFDAREASFQGVLLVSFALGVIVLAVLLIQVTVQGWPRLNLDLFRRFPSSLPSRAGAQSAIFGTLWVIGFTALFTVPLGVAAGIYLEEYADQQKWYNRLVEVNVQNLAAVPSIIYGILGLGFIVRGPLQIGFVVLAASLTLTLLILPTVILASREAIRAVPMSIRLASLALGATKWQTVYRQVLPSAVPGIATGIILALSRAIGEAAPLVLLGGLTFITFNPTGVFSPFTVMPIQIFNYVQRPQSEYRVVAAAMIVVLLAILLLMNSVAIWLRNRFRQEW
jgi:phosphate transport system permease protein